MVKVEMEMIHPFHDPVLCCPGERDVVPGLEVRHHVTQTHATGMGTHGHALTWRGDRLSRYPWASPAWLPSGTPLTPHSGRSSSQSLSKITWLSVVTEYDNLGFNRMHLHAFYTWYNAENLTELHCAWHEKLLEHDSILTRLPRGHACPFFSNRLQ